MVVQAGLGKKEDPHLQHNQSTKPWRCDSKNIVSIKGEIHQNEVTIINLYAPNVNAPNFIKHTLKGLKTHINSNTVVVGDFNTPYHQ
jgi:aspartate carbamoyltransferase regulatory subunit